MRYGRKRAKYSYHLEDSKKGDKELKFFDTVVDDAIIAPTMSIFNLSVIPQGNGESERVGRKITIKKIHMTGIVTLTSPSSGVQTSDCLICMLVQDKQTNGAQFIATDLLDLDGFRSFRNLANSQRFRVLYKCQYGMRVQGATRIDEGQIIFGEDIRIVSIIRVVNIPIEYDNSATDGRITSVRTNNIYWVTQSNEGILTSLISCRLRFED